jgi:hypothetical protein
MDLRITRSMQNAARSRVDNDVFHYAASGAPSDGTSGTGVGVLGPGSTYTDSSTGTWYINVGTKASPVWTRMAGVSSNRQIAGSLTSAQITSVAAGNLGHASGVPILAGQGAHNIVEFISLVLIYDFQVAAYGAGGNTTVNRTGGAAISSALTAGNGLASAADALGTLVPLAVSAMLTAENEGLSLVAAAAFTQPGTATGVLRWILNYRVHATGL